MAAQGVSEFLNTFPAIHNPLDGRQIERPDLLYHFSSVDDVQSAMITERSSSDNSIPTYLVYTGADYDQSVRKSPSIFDDIGYFFDLERTRAINGLSPPQDPALIIDVSVVSGLDARDLNSPGLATASYPGGKELLRESVALSSTKWKQVNFTTSQGSEANSVSAPSHIDFLFGFSDSTSDTYTLCVRGSNLYGIQYPTAKTNEWSGLQPEGAWIEN